MIKMLLMLKYYMYVLYLRILVAFDITHDCSYSDLRSANVQSTKEVIKLVVSGRKRKNLVYISTIGVFGGGQVEPEEYTDITQQR